MSARTKLVLINGSAPTTGNGWQGVASYRAGEVVGLLALPPLLCLAMPCRSLPVVGAGAEGGRNEIVHFGVVRVASSLIGHGPTVAHRTGYGADTYCLFAKAAVCVGYYIELHSQVSLKYTCFALYNTFLQLQTVKCLAVICLNLCSLKWHSCYI